MTRTKPMQGFMSGVCWRTVNGCFGTHTAAPRSHGPIGPHGQKGVARVADVGTPTPLTAKWLVEVRGPLKEKARGREAPGETRAEEEIGGRGGVNKARAAEAPIRIAVPQHTLLKGPGHGRLQDSVAAAKRGARDAVGAGRRAHPVAPGSRGAAQGTCALCAERVACCSARAASVHRHSCSAVRRLSSADCLKDATSSATTSELSICTLHLLGGVGEGDAGEKHRAASLKEKARGREAPGEARAEEEIGGAAGGRHGGQAALARSGAGLASSQQRSVRSVTYPGFGIFPRMNCEIQE